MSEYTIVAEADVSLTVGQSCSFTYRGNFSEVLSVALKVQASQYAEAVAWMRDLVTGCIFTHDRYV
jgi:Zn-dependent M16 (insulinase) family peptidase